VTEEKGQEVVAEETKPDEQESIRESMLKVYDEMEEKAAEEEPTEEAPEAPEAVEEPEGGEEAQEEPEAAPEAPEAAPEAAEETVEKDLGPEKIDPLPDWPDEVKEKFAKLPPELQDVAVRVQKDMQADYTRRIQGIKDITDALEPIREECVMNGVSYGQAIRKMVAAHERLLKQPREAALELLAIYGIDPRTLLEQPAGEADLPAPVAQKIQNLEAQVQQGAAFLQQQQMMTVQQQIDAFKKNAEFFDEVEQDMVAMVNQFQAAGMPPPPLQELYDRAVWTNPQVREKMLAKQRMGDVEEKVEKRKQRAAKAKVASKSVRGSAAPVPDVNGDGEPLSIREFLERQFDAAVSK